jgi:hypothetical protein
MSMVRRRRERLGLLLAVIARGVTGGVAKQMRIITAQLTTNRNDNNHYKVEIGSKRKWKNITQ